MYQESLLQQLKENGMEYATDGVIWEAQKTPTEVNRGSIRLSQF